MCNTTNENNEDFCDEPISGNMNKSAIDMEPINDEDFANFVKMNSEYCENADLTIANNDKKRKRELSSVENQSKFMREDLECFETLEDLMKDGCSNDKTINIDDNAIDKFYKCDHCKSTFSNLVTLNVHINNQHVAIVQQTGTLFLNSLSSRREKSFQISPCDVSQKSCSREEESVDSEGFKKPIEMPSYKKPLSVAQVCNDYDLRDFPLKVTKFNQAHFRHKPNFDRFVYPVLKVLNPEAQYFARKNLAEAKWYQIMNYKQTKRS